MSNLKIILIIGVVGVLGVGAGWYLGVSEDAGEWLAEESECNVLGLNLKGYLTTYALPAGEGEGGEDVTSAEDLVDGIVTAEDDDEIKAVILSVDSPGGDGVAGEEVASALRRLNKPSVAVVRAMGASAAYWAASGANKIYASKISDVGGIGVTSSYLDESVKNNKEGYTYTELSSAKYKDMGDPGRPLSAEERALWQADLDKSHQVFVGAVAANRSLELGAVQKLANGLTYLGEDALSLGLIDEIGDLAVATKFIEEQIGEAAQVCWY